MKSGLRRLVARCAATTLVGVVALSGASAAQAGDLGTQIGTGTLMPASGLDTDAPTISTSGPCPQAATHVLLVLYGQGFPSSGVNVQTLYPIATPPTNAAGGYEVAMQDTFQAFAQQQMPPVVLSGTYSLALVCQSRFPTTE